MSDVVCVCVCGRVCALSVFYVLYVGPEEEVVLKSERVFLVIFLYVTFLLLPCYGTLFIESNFAYKIQCNQHINSCSGNVV